MPLLIHVVGLIYDSHALEGIKPELKTNTVLFENRIGCDISVVHK